MIGRLFHDDEIVEKPIGYEGPPKMHKEHAEKRNLLIKADKRRTDKILDKLERRNVGKPPNPQLSPIGDPIVIPLLRPM